MPFNRGFYKVDIRYFFNVTLEAYRCEGNPVEISGLCIFDKKVILFGSEGSVKTFSPELLLDDELSMVWRKNNLPKAVVEVVDPIALDSKLVDCQHKHHNCVHDLSVVPNEVRRCFADQLVIRPDDKHVYVTLGLFTIVRMERDVQLLIPSFDFAVPHKEYHALPEENPCDLFSRLRFPIDEFFPPLREEFQELDGREDRGNRHHHDGRS